MPCCAFLDGVPEEITTVVILATFIFLVRLSVSITLFESLAKALSIKTKKKCTKFKENAFNTLYYAISLVVGYVTLIDTGWLDIPFFFPGSDGQVMSSRNFEWSSRWSVAYYIMSAAYYTQAAVASLTLDGHKSDKWVMFLHHILTLGLLYLSAYNGAFRLGFFVLLLHDISDVFLYTAKCFKCADSKWDQILFAFFAVSFYGLRLIIFPLVITVSCLLEWNRSYGPFMSCSSFWNLLCWPPLSESFFDHDNMGYAVFGVRFTYYGTMLFMLLALVCMHCWWGILIGRMIFEKLTTGHIEKDVRSDEEDDPEPKKDK